MHTSEVRGSVAHTEGLLEVRDGAARTGVGEWKCEVERCDQERRVTIEFHTEQRRNFTQQSKDKTSDSVLYAYLAEHSFVTADRLSVSHGYHT